MLLHGYQPDEWPALGPSGLFKSVAPEIDFTELAGWLKPFVDVSPAANARELKREKARLAAFLEAGEEDGNPEDVLPLALFDEVFEAGRGILREQKDTQGWTTSKTA